MTKLKRQPKPVPLTQDGKYGASDLKGGIGQALVFISQTALNLPKEEVDALAGALKEGLNDSISVLKKKNADLLSSAVARADVRPDQIMNAFTQAFQLYLALKGHGTKQVDMQVNFAVEELSRTQMTKENIKEGIMALSEELTRLKEELGGAEAPAAPECVKMIAVEEHQFKWLTDNKFIDLEGKWTGKEITDPKTADWVKEVMPELAEGSKVCSVSTVVRGEPGTTAC